MAVYLKPQALGFDASKFGMVEPKGSAMQFCRRVELPRGSISTTIKALAQKGHPCSWCLQFRISRQTLREVEDVEVFISHSWSADRWEKYLAVCYFLNRDRFEDK